MKLTTHCLTVQRHFMLGKPHLRSRGMYVFLRKPATEDVAAHRPQLTHVNSEAIKVGILKVGDATCRFSVQALGYATVHLINEKHHSWLHAVRVAGTQLLTSLNDSCCTTAQKHTGNWLDLERSEFWYLTPSIVLACLFTHYRTLWLQLTDDNPERLIIFGSLIF